MKFIVRYLANGWLSIADSYVSPRHYQRPYPDGFSRDRHHLAGDVMTLGGDMRKALASHGQRAYKPSSH